MESTTTSSSSGGFAGLLTVAFVVLKLTGVIGWSWWWVLAPVWIPAVVVLLIVAVVAVVAVARR
jgi:hypothetical protein